MCEIYDKIEQEGILQTLIGLVKKGLLTISQAAEQSNMTVEEFEKQVALLK